MREDEALPEEWDLAPHSLSRNPLDPRRPGVVFQLRHRGVTRFPEMEFEEAVAMWRDLGRLLGPFLLFPLILLGRNLHVFAVAADHRSRCQPPRSSPSRPPS